MWLLSNHPISHYTHTVSDVRTHQFAFITEIDPWFLSQPGPWYLEITFFMQLIDSLWESLTKKAAVIHFLWLCVEATYGKYRLVTCEYLK